jgi:hypothetical protein
MDSKQINKYCRIVGNKEYILYLEEHLLKELSIEQRRLIYYIYNRFSNSIKVDINNNNGLMEIHSSTIKTIFNFKPYREEIDDLIKRNIVSTDNQFIVNKKSKSYKLVDTFYLRFLEHKGSSPKVLYSTDTLKRVFRKPTVKHKIEYEKKDGSKLNPLIVETIGSMQGMINYQELLGLEEHCKDILNKGYKKRLAYPGDYHFFFDLVRQIDVVKSYLFKQGLDETTGTYQLLFKVGTNGRIFGNFQNKSRKIKTALFEGFRNYDISNSHPSILLKLLQQYDLPHTNFKEYVDDKSLKEKLAKESGISSVKDFKLAFLSILYGGKNTSHYSSSFLKTIYKNMSWELYDSCNEKEKTRFMQSKQQVINEVLEPFIKEIENWIDYLREHYIHKNIKKSRRGLYIENCLDRRFYVDECYYNNGKKIKRTKKGLLKNEVLHKISSHIINGFESQFIYTVTKLTTKHDNNIVVHNDFDGIVCTSKISNDSIIKACKQNGYICSTSFIEKPIDENYHYDIKQASSKLIL